MALESTMQSMAVLRRALCWDMPWEQGITHYELRVEPKVRGVMPCCQMPGVMIDTGQYGKKSQNTFLWYGPVMTSDISQNACQWGHYILHKQEEGFASNHLI